MTTVLRGQRHRPAVAGLPGRARPGRGRHHRCALGALPHDLPGLLEVDLGGCGLTAISCHAGNGIARLRFARPADVPAWLAQAPLASLAAAARAGGGYLVAESAPLDLPGRGPAALDARLGARPPAVPGHPQAWDPGGILNRGRAGL